MKRFLLSSFLCILGFLTMIIGIQLSPGFGGYIFLVALVFSIYTLYLALRDWYNWVE